MTPSILLLTILLQGASPDSDTGTPPKKDGTTAPAKKNSSKSSASKKTKSKDSDSDKPKVTKEPEAPKPAGPKYSYTEFHVPTQAIALTFDDGPHPKLTPRLLDMLKERNIKCTFFLIGKSAATYPDIVKRIVAEGHELGNHTWTHPILSHLSDAKVTDELQKTQDAIVNACGVTPKFFRPPYGSIKLSQKKWIMEKFHYPAIIWDVDTLDWKAPRVASKVHDTIMKETKAGSIILCHDIHETTIDAMTTTLDELKAKGFEFKTISEMIALEAEAASKPPTPPVTASPPADNPPKEEVKPAVPAGSPAVPGGS